MNINFTTKRLKSNYQERVRKLREQRDKLPANSRQPTNNELNILARTPSYRDWRSLKSRLNRGTFNNIITNKQKKKDTRKT